MEDKLLSSWDFSTDMTCMFKGITFDTIDVCAPDHYPDIIYIHKTNCPCCGALLDGDELKPYVYCQACNAKVWSEREVS